MSLRERLDTIRSSPTPPNEESAKQWILAPILQSLGWDPFGPEVSYELPVGSKRSGGRVDIALKSAGRFLALIEAKSPGADLSSHVGQVLGYAFHEGVDICVLTTGLEWWLYLPRESGPPQDRRFSTLKITEDPVDQLVEDFEAFLSKEKLVNGQAERRARDVRKASLEAAHLSTEMPGIWQRMLSEPDDELVELFGKRVYEQVSLRPTKPQLVAALRGSPIPSANVPAEEMTKTPPSSQSPQIPKPKRPKTSKRPIAMELWGERYEIRSHAAAYRKLVDCIFEKYRDKFHLIQELSLPEASLPYVARDPEMLGNRGRKHYYEPLSSGHFFIVPGTIHYATALARALLTEFGHDPSEFEIAYEDSVETSPNNYLGTGDYEQHILRTTELKQEAQYQKPVAVELWGERHEVESYVDAYKKFLNLLYDRHTHDFHRVQGLRRSGSRFPFAARNPEMLSLSGRTRCYKPRQSEYYFVVHGNSKQLRTRVRKLLELFGHDPSDFKWIYE